MVSVARRYARSGLAFLDLIQEGNLALIRAAEKADETKGYKVFRVRDVMDSPGHRSRAGRPVPHHP